MKEVTIREAVPSDAEQIVRIETREFDPPATILAMRKAIKNDKFEVFVAVDNEKVIGHAVTQETTNQSEKRVICIAVDAACRREGVGRALVEYLQSEMTGGVLRLKTRVIAERIPAQYFFAAMGFKCLGESTAESTKTREQHPCYEFMYQVPFDRLSDLHLSMIAGAAKARRTEGKLEC
jgi:ribosomal protein S18 acetylase RimI-like enzyme